MEKEITTKKYLIFGLAWGLCMHVIMPLAIDSEITQYGFLVGITVWLTCGLACGFIMKLWTSSKRGVADKVLSD